MKLHDDIQPDPPSDRDTAWKLIPWYVNGTLSEEETRLVEAEAAKYASVAEEIARQSHMAERVAKTDPFDVPLERSWETLRAQVEADLAARTPAKPGLADWLAPFRGRGIAALGGLAAAAIVLVVGLEFSTGPGKGDFVTLTSDKASQDVVVQFQTAGEMEIDALTALLAPLGIITVTGPSDSGVYSAVLAENADARAVADAIMKREEFLFAAPGANQ